MGSNYPFWYGGASGVVAAVCTHPLDLAKARMQTAAVPGDGMLGVLVHVARTDGLRGVYSGLSASILRQATYTTARFGVYEALKQRASGPGGRTPPTYVLLPISMFSGLIGSLVGNPADLVNVRMQNDKALPPSERRNYRNAIDGLVRIVRNEGFATLGRGAVPNAVRGILMTASQVVSYDKGKQWLVHTAGLDPTAQTTFFAASMWAGLVATTVCSPADVVKTLAMNSREKLSARLVMDQVRREGLRFLFRGWTPAFVRLGPQTIVTFVVLEHLKKWRVGMPKLPAHAAS